MSTVEIVTYVGFAAAGAAVGSLSVYFGTRRPQVGSDEIRDKNKPAIKQYSSTDSIPKSELEKSKRELRTIVLEKELVSAALTRLYEAEVAKEITREEREILGAKYKTELKTLDERISKVDAFIQIGDLETLRSQLLELVNQKMEAIETRIESTRKAAEPFIADMLRRPVEKQAPISIEEKPKVPDISDLLQKPVPVTSIANNAVSQPTLSIKNMEPTTDQNFVGKKSGEKVAELQKELLEALDRLEKLDVES